MYGLDPKCILSICLGEMNIDEVLGIVFPLIRIDPSRGSIEEREELFRQCLHGYRSCWGTSFQQAVPIALKLFRSGRVIQPALEHRFRHPIIDVSADPETLWVPDLDAVGWETA